MPFTALVPLDGSPLGLAVLPHVLGFRPREIVLLHVRDAYDEAPEAVPADLWLGETLARVKEAAPATAVRTLVIDGDGPPAGTILEVAAQVQAGLLALTTHGRTGFNRLVLGSVAEEVIRASAIPVLAVRRDEAAASATLAPQRVTRVLVAYDASGRAAAVLDTLGAMGQAGGPELVLGGVVEAGRHIEAPVVPDPNAMDAVYHRYLATLEERLAAALDSGVARARTLGFEATSRIARGRPSDELLLLADTIDASVIALSTRGRSGPLRWLLGSVTEQVLRVSSRPVLIAR